MGFQKPPGTQDFLPGAVEKWQFVESKARDICRRFNFREIRTPIFEATELYKRGVGETTDIVEKEMYTFTDRGNRSLLSVRKVRPVQSVLLWRISSMASRI